MWKMYSDGGNEFIKWGPVVFTYLFFNERARCFYYVFLLTITKAISDILKLHFI